MDARWVSRSGKLWDGCMWGGAVVGAQERPAVQGQGEDLGLQTYFWQPPVYEEPADADAFPCNQVRRNSSVVSPLLP